MTQKTGRFGASGREFCLYSLEKEDIEEYTQMKRGSMKENNDHYRNITKRV